MLNSLFFLCYHILALLFSLHVGVPLWRTFTWRLNEKIAVIFVSSDLHFSGDCIVAYCFVMNPACLWICILFCQVIVNNLQLSRLSEFVNFVGLSWSGMGWVVCVLLASFSPSWLHCGWVCSCVWQWINRLH